MSDRRWDYDTFRYGVYWYAYRGGHWYRARSWRGPYVVLASTRVPRAIINVPARHWKRHPHGAPPGLAKKHGGPVYVDRKSRVHVKDDHDHGKGKGNKKGKDKGRGH